MGTPVHSLVLMRPSICCGVTSVCTEFRSYPPPPLFPEHSRNWILDTEGKRFRSRRVKDVGRSTIPWIRSSYRCGSMAGTPA